MQVDSVRCVQAEQEQEGEGQQAVREKADWEAEGLVQKAQTTFHALEWSGACPVWVVCLVFTIRLMSRLLTLKGCDVPNELCPAGFSFGIPPANKPPS